MKLDLHVYSTERFHTYAGVSAAAWSIAGGPPKEDLQLRVEQLHVLAMEDLGHKVPTFLQDMSCDVQCL